MKVALTGTTGHLGGAILRELVTRGIQVKALVRRPEQCVFRDPLVEYVTGHLHDPVALNQLTKTCDACIHSAALISVDGDPDGQVRHVNVEGTRMVLHSSTNALVKRFIYISSVHAFKQKPSQEVLDEARMKVDNKGTAYDRTKRDAEQLVLSYLSPEMEVLIMNPTALIGPYDDKPSAMGQALLRMFKRQLPFSFPAGFDFSDTRDVASAIVNGLAMGTSGENYILGGRWYPVRDLAAMLSQVTGKKIPALEFPFLLGWIGLPVVRAIGRVQRKAPLYTGEVLTTLKEGNRHISHAKAKRDLGYSPRPLTDTIRDTMNWFSENGYLD